MLAIAAVLVMILGVLGLLSFAGWPGTGAIFFSVLLGGFLMLVLAFGIARHARVAQILGLFLCIPISLWFLSIDPQLAPIRLGVGVPAGVVAILLLAALMQKPKLGE